MTEVVFTDMFLSSENKITMSCSFPCILLVSSARKCSILKSVFLNFLKCVELMSDLSSNMSRQRVALSIRHANGFMVLLKQKTH